MKAFVVVEGACDAALVMALLRNDEQVRVSVVSVGTRSSFPSVASTLIVKHRQPLAAMVATKSLDASIIHETLITMDQLLRAVAGDTPVAVISCVPELEVIFFESTITLKRIFPQYDEHFFLMFAKTRPKDALDWLYKNGGGPGDLQQLLAALTEEEIDGLRSTYPIQQLVGFIDAVCNPVPQ